MKKDLLKSHRQVIREMETAETIRFHSKRIERLINKEIFPGCEIKVTIEVVDTNQNLTVGSCTYTAKKGIGNGIGYTATTIVEIMRNHKEELQFTQPNNNSHD